MIGECEMTGRQNVELFRVKVEGILMNVCKECVKYGERIDAPSAFKTQQFSSQLNTDEDKVIVKNYGSLIKQARELRNLKQSDVARQLNEKESLIHKVESSNMTLNFTLAKKLEKFFHITLIESIAAPSRIITPSSQSDEPLTMEAAFKKALEKAKK